jgi:hypothetical protein
MLRETHYAQENQGQRGPQPLAQVSPESRVATQELLIQNLLLLF